MEKTRYCSTNELEPRDLRGQQIVVFPESTLTKFLEAGLATLKGRQVYINGVKAFQAAEIPIPEGARVVKIPKIELKDIKDYRKKTK